MNPEEKTQNARDMRDTIHQNQLFAEERSGKVSDEFTRLEVQIATILFAFLSVFFSAFKDNLGEFTHGQVLAFKYSFAVILLLLIASLIVGLIHLKRSEQFWDSWISQRIRRWDQWNKASRHEVTFEQACTFHEGATLGKGSHIVNTPSWTWILQSVLLGLAIAIIFTLSLVLLFNS